jgi:hypothetical protein
MRDITVKISKNLPKAVSSFVDCWKDALFWDELNCNDQLFCSHV